MLSYFFASDCRPCPAVENAETLKPIAELFETRLGKRYLRSKRFVVEIFNEDIMKKLEEEFRVYCNFLYEKEALLNPGINIWLGFSSIDEVRGLHFAPGLVSEVARWGASIDIDIAVS